MNKYEEITDMGIEEMANFLGFFNLEEMVCSCVNPNMGVDFCRLHKCEDCTRIYLERDVTE